MFVESELVAWRRASSLLVVAALWSVPQASLAQAPSEADPRVEEAREHFEEAERNFEAGNYALALRGFQESESLMEGHPRRFFIAFNIGRCHEELGNDGRAAEAYRRFLAEGGADTDLAAEVRQRLTELETRAEIRSDRGSGPTRDAAPTSSEGSEADTSDGVVVAGWILLGTGIAAMVAGGGLIVGGLVDEASVENAADGSSWADLRGAADRAPTLFGAGLAVAIAGVAAAASGLVVLVASSGRSTDDAVVLRLNLGGFSLVGSFR